MTASSEGRERLPRKGDRFEATITGLDRRGLGCGTAGEYSVALRHALPGSRVILDVGRRRGKKLEGRIDEVLDPGPHARPARCEHYGTCGGCSFQTLDYAVQLTELQRIVTETLAEQGLLDSVTVDPIVGCENPWNYRNKMDFTFANRRWVATDEPEGLDTSFALGMHAPGRFDKVIDIQGCSIHFPEADGLLRSVREIARDMQLAPWDIKTHEGLLRHLVLRKGVRTNEIMVDLVTSRAADEELAPFYSRLLERHPEITTIVQNINTRVATVAVGETERVIHGPGLIHEELLGLRYTISANSFFQTNTAQAERLFEIVREEARASEARVAYDLYCGAGTIALALAAEVEQVWGFESVPAAIADAKLNAKVNGIGNAHFVLGDVLDGLRGPEAAARPRPDLLVVDPPRAGLHPKLFTPLFQLQAKRLVYVSCNIGAAARDLVPLCSYGYTLKRVRPVDLFPHTPHVECVLTLERED